MDHTLEPEVAQAVRDLNERWPLIEQGIAEAIEMAYPIPELPPPPPDLDEVLYNIAVRAEEDLALPPLPPPPEPLQGVDPYPGCPLDETYGIYRSEDYWINKIYDRVEEVLGSPSSRTYMDGPGIYNWGLETVPNFDRITEYLLGVEALLLRRAEHGTTNMNHYAWHGVMGHALNTGIYRDAINMFLKEVSEETEPPMVAAGYACDLMLEWSMNDFDVCAGP